MSDLANKKQTSIWRREFLPQLRPSRLIRRFFSLRMVRRYLFFTACLATLIAIFYAEENWRGRRAWLDYKNEWEAKGEIFDFDKLIPPPVPDAENFALTHFFAESHRFWDKSRRNAPLTENEQLEFQELRIGIDRTDSGKPDVQPDLARWDTATNTDLAAWQAYYRYRRPKNGRKTAAAQKYQDVFPVPPQPAAPAADVLLALSLRAGALKELRQAGRLPVSRFPINYEDGYGAMLPHLARLKQAVRYLQLLNAAELASGRAGAAGSNVDLMFYVSDADKAEKFLISYLVRNAMLDFTVSTIWEGLSGHSWSAEQLAGFQKRLEAYDLLGDYRQAIQNELAMGCRALDDLASRRAASPIAGMLDDTQERDFDGQNVKESRGFEKELFIRTAPRGWFEQNKLNCAILIHDRILAAVDPQAQRINASLPESPEDVRRSRDDSPYTFLGRWFVPPLAKSAQKCAREQTALNLADVACALERYRLANGQYPESLGQLAPQFINKLPHEIITGEPLKYRRAENGRFVLYSVGWEGKDFGGLSRSADGKLNGDWVWTYPEKSN